MFLPFLPLIAMERGATPLQTGLLQGAAYVGGALALLPAGWLADRLGPKQSSITLWLLGAAGVAALSLPGSWAALLPGAVLALVGAAAVPALAAWTAHSVPPGQLRRTMSVVFAAGPGGLLIGSSLGGVVADRAGLSALCLAAAGATLLAAAALMGIPAVIPAESAGSTMKNRRRSEMGLLILIAVPAGIGGILLALPSGFMTPYLREVMGLSLTGTGVTNAQLAVGQLAWSALFAAWPGEQGELVLPLGRGRVLALRRGTVIALAICLGANGLFGLLFPVGRLSAVLPALLLRGAHFSLQPLGMALVAESTGAEGGLATRFSVLAMLMGLATALSQVLSGALYEIEPALPFYITGVAATAGALVLGYLAVAGHCVPRPQRGS